MPRSPLSPGVFRVAAVASLLLAAACTPGGSSDTAQNGGEGGFIVFRMSHEGVAVLADLFASASQSLPDFPSPDGTCHVTPHSDAGSRLIAVTGLDLGPSLSVTGPAEFAAPLSTSEVDSNLDGVHAFPATETLDVQHQGTLYGYSAGVVGAGASGSYTISNDGAADGLPAQTLATVQVPTAITAEGDYTLATFMTPGEPAAVAWSGGGGAQAIHVYLDGDDATGDCYVDPSHRSFVIPADITQALGANGQAVISALVASDLDIDGRIVHLVVLSDYLD